MNNFWLLSILGPLTLGLRCEFSAMPPSLRVVLLHILLKKGIKYSNDSLNPSHYVLDRELIHNVCITCLKQGETQINSSYSGRNGDIETILALYGD